MGVPLRVLLVEDSEDDAALLARELRRAGYDLTMKRVDTREELLDALDREHWDIVISDYSMPHLSGLIALGLVQEKDPDLPFILVSGTIGEELAVEAMKAGAHDYVMKDSLARLVPAVGRELSDAELRRKHRQAQEAFEESRRLLEAVVETAPNLIVLSGPDGGIQLFNRACEVLTGYDREEVLGKSIVELLVPPQWRPVVQKRFADPYSPRLLQPHEHPWLTKSGQERLIEWRCTVLPDPTSGGACVLGLGVDVTERRRMEEALCSSEERFRTIFEGAAEGILVAEVESRRFVYANPAICRMLGYEEEELLRLTVNDIHPEEDLPRVMAEFEAQARGEKFVAADLPCLRKDGTKISADIWTSNLVIDNRRCNVGFFTDITDRKRVEEQLRQAQRMEAIGRLAGGVAHDFNNLLAVIAGYCELLLDDLGQESPLRASVEEIGKAAGRAVELTSRLLTISREQVVQPEVLDLNALIANVEQTLRRLIGEDMLLETALAPDLGKVRVDPGQVEQVLLNLAANARDAMPQGGKLTIETANVELDEPYALIHNGVEPGRYVLLAVSDTGTGIDAKVLPHIFEPFFTTKREGKGTGLGLSIVYSIVHQSGGHIRVYSEARKGTAFKIYLPVAGEAVREAQPAPVSAPSEQGSGVILVVEDQEAVREMLTRALTVRGYTVFDAAGGEEAIRFVAGHHGPIDLLITDVVMPVMSGRELAERLTAERPGMKVLFISGFADRAVIHHGMLSPGINYLQKPFPLSELAHKVQEILKGPSAPGAVSGR
jgi:two-component system cell cycle sensor histidine kinase/response regulator CckA